MMKSKTKILLFSLAGLLIVAVVFVALAIMDAEKKLAEERALLSAGGSSLDLTSASHEQRLDENKREGWKQLTCLHDVRDIESYEGFLFLATGGGLVKFTSAGEMVGSFSQLNGLTDVNLSSLFYDDGYLYVGSRQGLSVIREENIAAYNISDPDFGGVTSLIKYDGRLLLGTRGAGILAFTSDGISKEFIDIPGADFKDVTCLFLWNSSLAVGTRDAGLFIHQGASFVNITSLEGLKTDHITSLSGEEQLLITTTEGVYQLDDQLKLSVWTESVMASAILEDDGITYLGTLDGKCHLYIRGSSRNSWAFGNKFNPAITRAIVRADDRIWALTSNGAYHLSSDGPQKLEIPGSKSLKGSYIASMTMDSRGSIWLGYFDQGIEVLDNNLIPKKYFDEPEVKTVKYLEFNPGEEAVYVGSSKGMTRIGNAFDMTSFNRGDGIIHNEVNHLCFMESGGFSLGTGGGVSLIENNEIKSIYAFHGLINNKVFTQLETELELVGSSGTKLIAGTLGGISVIKGSRVVGSITPENSELPIHWITALAEVDGAIFIGTYGGGVAVINPDSSWAEMPGFIKGLEINPNAFYNSENYFFAGTLDSGILVLDKEESRWRLLREDIGSMNITAFSEDESRFYIGSDYGLTVVDKGSLVQ